MGATFIIIYSVLIVVFIVVLFVIGLFTHLSPSFILIMMFMFLALNFCISAGYAAQAAGQTGGKDADSQNKTAHEYYTWAAVISWIIVGVAVLAIIVAIVIAFLGGGEAAVAAEGTVAVGEGAVAVGEAGAVATAAETAAAEETATLTAQRLVKQGISTAEAEAASNAVSSTEEGRQIAERVAKEKKAGKSIFDTGHGASKLFHVFMYILLGLLIALSLTVGILMFIGASIQAQSDQKKGLKKAWIAASINLFISIAYIIFFLVMYFRGRSLHKRLEQDLAKQEQLTRDYLQQSHQGIQEAKGIYAREIISHHLGLDQMAPQPVPQAIQMAPQPIPQPQMAPQPIQQLAPPQYFPQFAPQYAPPQYVPQPAQYPGNYVPQPNQYPFSPPMTASAYM